MNKSLYSLMLMDSVVERIDRIASRENTNRSNLVNQILADYVSMMTPEKRIDNIFKSIEEFFAENTDLVPFLSPGSMSMSMKSSLQYKYRPTIKYSVQLFRIPEESIGEFNVIFRTRSAPLLASLTNFFRMWKKLEDTYIAKHYLPGAINYELQENRLMRSIALPADRDYTNKELAEALCNYIEMFDELLKGYLAGEYSPADLEERYVEFLNSGIGFI